MRFSQAKTHAIAEKIVDVLETDPEATLLSGRPEIELAIAGAITADLREEQEIEEEVEKVLEQYRLRIEYEGMDANLLHRKVKQEIARKRGFKL